MHLFDPSRRQFMGLVGVGVVPAPATGAPAPGRSLPEVFDVTRFGAVGDGKTAATAALQRALDACGAAGGGTVLVPAGTYASGALFLRSHVNLHLAGGATLRASQEAADFPPLAGRDEGIERRIHSSLLTGIDLENVSITGQGRIDGQGERWWKADEATRQLRLDGKLPREAEHPAGAPLTWPRPRVINLIRCRGVLVDGVTIEDGACINLHLVYCEDVVIVRCTTFQRRVARGTEGIVIDSSKRVSVMNCTLSAGTDCICIKSGYNEEGRRIGRASEDIVITNCHMPFTAASGVAIGSEIAGGIRNVLVSNCVIGQCLSGIYIRAPRGRGGVVEQIRMSNLVIDRVDEMAIKLSHFFDSVRLEGRWGPNTGRSRTNLETARSRKAPVDPGTPTFRDITFSDLTLGRVREVALVEGLPERFIRKLVFENITVSEAAAGISCSMTGEVSVSNLTVGNLAAPAVDARDVERLELHRLKCARPNPETPLVWLENVAGAFVFGCDVGEAGKGYEWLRQEQCRAVTLAANNVPVVPVAVPAKAP